MDKDAAFEAFWAAYPRHTAKSVARKTFQKLNPSTELLAIILAAVEDQKTWQQWQKDDGQFIPMPATWLNQERWEDEQVQLAPTPRKKIDVAALCAAEDEKPNLRLRQA